MYEIYLKLLDQKGVKTSDVCRATGIRSSTMTDWKKGRTTPKADKLKLIADYFGVDISVFYSDEKKYYSDETAEIAQEIFESKDLKLLFDVAHDASPEDLKLAYDMLLTLKRKEQGL